MAVRVVTVFCLLAAATAFDLNLPSLEASLQTEGKQEETPSVTTSSSSFESSSGSIAPAPAVVSTITYPTQTSSFTTASSSGVGQDAVTNTQVTSSSSGQGAASITDKFEGGLLSSGGLSASLSNAPAPASASFNIGLGSQGAGSTITTYESHMSSGSNAPAPASASFNLGLGTQGASGSSFTSHESHTSSSANSPAPISTSFNIGLGSQGAGSTITSYESHTSSSANAPAPASGSFNLGLGSQAASGSSFTSHESLTPSSANAPAPASGSFNIGLGSQAASGSSLTSHESHTSSSANAPAPASGSFNLGLGSQAASGSSFTSHESHTSSSANAPAPASGSFNLGLRPQGASGSSFTSHESQMSSISHAPAPIQTGYESSSHSTMTSISSSEHASAPTVFSPPASSSTVSTSQSSTTDLSQFSPPVTSSEGSHVSTLTISESTSSQKEPIYEPLSQPWVSLLQKRFWWVRSLLQKYLRSDFPWKVFSAHPKLWLSIGGGYLRRSSLNEFPFSANKLVWYHPDFENFVYVFSSDSGEGFWASPPEDAISSLFASKEGSYKIEFIPSEFSAAELSNSDWSSSHTYRPLHVAFAPGFAESSSANCGHSYFKPQYHSASLSGLRVPIPLSSYIVASSEERRPASPFYHSQYLSAPAPSPFSSYTSGYSAIDPRAQLISYSPYYTPFGTVHSRYITAHPSQFSTTSVSNISPISELKYVYYSKPKHSLLPKEASELPFLQYIKTPFPKAVATSTVRPYVIPPSSVDRLVVKKPYFLLVPQKDHPKPMLENQ